MWVEWTQNTFKNHTMTYLVALQSTKQSKTLVSKCIDQKHVTIALTEVIGQRCRSPFTDDGSLVNDMKNRKQTGSNPRTTIQTSMSSDWISNSSLNTQNTRTARRFFRRNSSNDQARQAATRSHITTKRNNVASLNTLTIPHTNLPRSPMLRQRSLRRSQREERDVIATDVVNKRRRRQNKHNSKPNPFG